MNPQQAAEIFSGMRCSARTAAGAERTLETWPLVREYPMTLFSYISASCFGNYGTLTTSNCRDPRKNRVAATQRPPAIAGEATGHSAIPLI